MDEEDVGIHSAASTGNISSLIATLETSPGSVNEVNHFGMTPLHGAAFHGQLEAAKILIEAGADVNRPSSGSKFTFPLHLAVTRLHKPLIELLIIQGGADLACKDYLGHSVLDVAQGISVETDSVAKDPDTNIQIMNFIKECASRRASDQPAKSKSFVFESKHSENLVKGPVANCDSISDAGDYKDRTAINASNNVMIHNNFNSGILQ